MRSDLEGSEIWHVWQALRSHVLPAPAGSLDPRGKARRPLGQGFLGLTSGSPAPRLRCSTVRHHQSRKTQQKLVCRQLKASPPRAAKPRAERLFFGSRSEGFLRLAEWLSQPRAPPPPHGGIHEVRPGKVEASSLPHPPKLNLQPPGGDTWAESYQGCAPPPQLRRRTSCSG